MEGEKSSWEKWKEREHARTNPREVDVRVNNLPGRFRVARPSAWASCISALSKYIAYHLRYQEGDKLTINAQGGEEE